MNDTRIEVDLLGERKVPNDCYYGVHTLRALATFTSSRGCMNDEPDFIRGMVFVKKASALTNKELGALPGDVARIAGGTSTRPSRAGNPAAHTHSPSSQNS